VTFSGVRTSQACAPGKLAARVSGSSHLSEQVAFFRWMYYDNAKLSKKRERLGAEVLKSRKSPALLLSGEPGPRLAARKFFAASIFAGTSA